MNRYKYICLTLCAILGAEVLSMAQVSPSDKDREVSLGFGVAGSQFLSTASSMTITREELQQTAAIGLQEALYGRILGLSAISDGGFVGDEGAGASFSIRGSKTLSSNKILILVDGYERPIDRLTVEEVESVTVLKDAAALGLLGHEGVNGAILVKTKRGTSERFHVKAAYSHKFTFDPETAPMMDAYGYATALNRARTNDGLAPTYSDAELELLRTGSDPLMYPNVDWKKEVYRNLGSENEANVSIYGGTDKVRYYTLLDYTGSRGLLNNTKQKEYNSQLKYSKANIRANIDFDVTKTTHVGVDLLAMFAETSRPNDIDANGASWYIYKTPASAFPLRTSGGYWGGNEAYGDGNVAAKIQESGYQKTHQRQIWANAKFVQDFDFWVKGLSLQANIGYDNASIMCEQRSKGHQYAYEYYAGAIGDKDNVTEVVMGNKEENLKFNKWVDSQWRRFQSSIGIYYKHSFRTDDHFSASAQYNVKNSTLDGRHNTYNRMNILVAAHYDLKDKFSADLTLAANGSNRCYPATWSFSPTLGLAYIFASKPSGALTFGKVRLSGGRLHTDYVPEAGIWLSQWDKTNGTFYFGTGASSAAGNFIKAFPTTSFHQEAANMANLGVDLRLWDSLDLTLEGFYQNRDHIMVSASDKNSWVVGIQSSYEDVGKVNSYGFELGARYNKTFANSLRLNLVGQVSLTENQISYTIENPAYPNLATIGHRVNEAWGLEAIGFFKDEADIASSPSQEFSRVRPGDIKYKDQNGDGVINQFDRIALGSGKSTPDLNYSFNIGLEYKGFGFNIQMQGAGRHMKNLLGVDGVWSVIAGNKNLSQEYYNNCYDTCGENALYPRLTSETVENNTQNSSLWYKNVWFLKMRNCQIYYKFPKSLISKMKVTDTRVFVKGENLFGFDNIKAMDAEVLSTHYPMLKGVNIGLSVTF